MEEGQGQLWKRCGSAVEGEHEVCGWVSAAAEDSGEPGTALRGERLVRAPVQLALMLALPWAISPDLPWARGRGRLRQLLLRGPIRSDPI